MSLSRSKFEELVEPLISKTLAPTRRAMKDAGLSKGEVDKVILVGGSTRVPAVQTAIEKEVGKAPFKGVNPDEAVAMGAALQAGIIVGDSGYRCPAFGCHTSHLGNRNLGRCYDNDD